MQEVCVGDQDLDSFSLFNSTTSSFDVSPSPSPSPSPLLGHPSFSSVIHPAKRPSKRGKPVDCRLRKTKSLIVVSFLFENLKRIKNYSGEIIFFAIQGYCNLPFSFNLKFKTHFLSRNITSVYRRVLRLALIIISVYSFFLPLLVHYFLDPSSHSIYPWPPLFRTLPSPIRDYVGQLPRPALLDYIKSPSRFLLHFFFFFGVILFYLQLQAGKEGKNQLWFKVGLLLATLTYLYVCVVPTIIACVWGDQGNQSISQLFYGLTSLLLRNQTQSAECSAPRPPQPE